LRNVALTDPGQRQGAGTSEVDTHLSEGLFLEEPARKIIADLSKSRTRHQLLRRQTQD